MFSDKFFQNLGKGFNQLIIQMVILGIVIGAALVGGSVYIFSR
jgi:hypothetical protein